MATLPLSQTNETRNLREAPGFSVGAPERKTIRLKIDRNYRSRRGMRFCFASSAVAFRFGAVLELEVYAAGVRDLNKILELDQELAAVPGLRYKIDSNHDLVYMELEEPTVTLREIRGMFRKLALEPRFIGAIPSALRSRSETQLLST